ncbi:kinase-like domain-containing protein [Glomus cerebriforme]|uniref:non-specific serine/threonine protein kinase n=1 Tax=Glomus cerebriforme TaxID=658196 RepID=A0A397T9A4_9GLOM|nr:kinase-like domain-containing protein [Glomus cerebriforme]
MEHVKNVIKKILDMNGVTHVTQNVFNKILKIGRGNDSIDEFIRDTQLSAVCREKVLEWIPYDRFHDIEYIAKGGFSKVYKANWIDGYIDKWDNENQNWERLNSDDIVALKSLNNSKNITSEFFNEIASHHKIVGNHNYINNSIVRLYGITQDPETKNYMMVLEYAEDGSLRNYLDKSYDTLSWENKFSVLCFIAIGLTKIHDKELIHRDLHIGNILYNLDYACITDMGLCKPADYNTLENKRVYGVLPYIAPEILRGQNYTKASDIYSFGIIIYEVISGLPPYHDVNHDENLAIKICEGFRPRFNIKQIKEAEEIIKNSSVSSILSTSLALSYETHSKAIYTKSLQINISQLNMNGQSNQSSKSKGGVYCWLRKEWNDVK